MKRRQLFLALPFVLPNLLGFLLFTVGPVLFTLGAAFTNANLMRTVPFRMNGFENFGQLFADPEFGRYFLNTLYFLIGLPVAIAGSLALAILLSQKIKGIVVYRTLLYLPSFTSGVALMILWKALLNPDWGPVNAAIEALGFQGPKWLLSVQSLAALAVEGVGIDPKQFGLGARDAIVLMGIWTSIGGGNMLLYLS
jgi:multiple sugar transport system permease protein